MITEDTIKHYFWAILGVIGVVLFWAGLWDGVGYLWYLSNPLVSLVAGLIILAASGLLLKEFDPLQEEEKKIKDVLYKVHKHPKKHEFHIKFYDKLKKKDTLFEAKHIKAIEKNFLVFVKEEGKEIFVPLHRVTEVIQKCKSFWKAKS